MSEPALHLTPAWDRAELLRRADEARGGLAACDLCARECRVDRAGGAPGFCGLTGEARWFREMMIYGIEMELIPAHAIYFTGCNLRCAFCNVSERIERPLEGQPWDAAWMAERVELRRREGAKTLLVLGGEPTVNLPAVLELLALLPERVPLAWDSNLLLSARSRELLRGMVDLYVADFKFGNDECARRIGAYDGYLAAMAENLPFAEQSARLIVRHLLLPGHYECCYKPVLARLGEWLARPRLSLRWEYLPPAASPRDPRLLGYNHRKIRDQARQDALAAGIELVE